MLIGLSLSRCVRDIVLKEVDIYDVIVIIARTKFNWENSEDQQAIWESYAHANMFHDNTWYDLDKDAVYETIDNLWSTGRIHQPGLFGAHPASSNRAWVTCIIPPKHATPAEQDAWDNYKFISQLTKETFYKDDF